MAKKKTKHPRAEDVFKKFKDLAKVRDRFKIPEEPKPDLKAVKEKTQQDEFKAESEEIVKRSQRTIKYIKMAVNHVNTYDSKETALEIVNKAYATCPSSYNKRLISNASQSLKAAIKAEKWMKSKRRRRHVDKATVQKNVNSFHEKINEAVVSISIEIEKRTNQLFKRVKEQYTSDLPLQLALSKPYVVKNAHVILYTMSKPTRKVTHLEASLYLAENAKVIGVNTKSVKTSPLKRAEGVARKLGYEVYPHRLSRPAENIEWYLISNFGTAITMASFADSMLLEDGNSTGYTSYEDFVSAKEAAKRVTDKLKTQRLKSIREQFAEDNVVLVEDIKEVQRQLENNAAELKEMKEHFSSLTMVSDTSGGLSFGENSVKHLDRVMELYRDNLIRTGMPWLEANKQMLRQRVEAKSYYYAIMDLREKTKRLRQHLNFLKKDMEKRRVATAADIGLVNINHYVTDNID